MSEKSRRVVTIGAVALIFLLATGWAHRDIELRREADRALRSESIREVARVTEMFFLADEARTNGLLERLRIELRAQGLWASSATVDALSRGGDGRNEIDARRLHGVLRRGLSANEDVAALELVTAGHDGLSTFRLERGTSQDALPALDPKQREGFAKALWYADEVRRAVVSAGRRVERGDLGFETLGDVEEPILKVAIGLHDPGELVQAVLVASLNVRALAARLEALSTSTVSVSLLMPDGRRLGPIVGGASEPAIDSRDAALAARVLGAAEPPELFEVAERMIYGRILTHADGSQAHLLTFIEAAAPARGFAAWTATAWPVALTLLGLVSGFALVGVLRGGGTEATVRPAISSNSAAGAHRPSASSQDEIEVSTARFALREWLGDVRGCLERDAATRGLTLDLRCDRDLPNEVESDPAWLGGLLVAMGREALDATSGERVRLDVLEDVGETLRFELAAEDAALAPICGMQEVAGRLSGRFESEREGRFALVLTDALRAG